VGNGIAGIMTAARLRALEPDAGRLCIEIYTREPFEYYSRIRLPEVFASGMAAADLAIYKPGWYEEKRISVFKAREVVRIDPQAQSLSTADGIEVTWDELVLCMGADSLRPPIRNAGLEGVFTIREYGDADAIRAYLRRGTRHAVVVGGGLLGLEASRYMQEPPVERVTVVEIMPRLLPRQLDEPGSRLLLDMLRGPTSEVILGAQVAEFLGERAVNGIRLTDGRQLPAETVLISAGIVPRTSLAAAAGIEVRRGIVVDEHLCTSAPHVWAAGDLVEYQGVVWGIIPAALEHAPVVAANILGREPLSYRQTVPQNTLKIGGTSLTSIGTVDIQPAGEAAWHVVARVGAGGQRYEKYVLRDGILAGAILLGSRENYSFVTGRMGTAVTPEEIQARLG
jgi:nitrite reductase (NADH) large subunit